MSHLLALIGTRNSTNRDIDRIIDFHLAERPAFWSGKQHSHWARGSRVVAKIAGVGVIALTGTLECLQPEHDPLIVEDQRWDWRYDMNWDDRPPRVVPVSELGAPFDRPIRSAQRIGRDDFRRAYTALHGSEPISQLPPQH